MRRHLMKQLWSQVKLKLAPPRADRLELGSAQFPRPGWLTLDLSDDADVVWDLRRRLPFAAATFTAVYCSHLLEHFSYPELRRLLGEVRRILAPGGQFLIAVPDAALYVDAYLGKRDPAPLVKYQPAVISDAPMDILNYVFYMNGSHKFMFDAQNLKLHCEAAGFVNCRPRPFDPALDRPERAQQSLHFVCERPSS